MSLSMYDLTVPVLARGLGVLAAYVDKAEAFAAERGVEPSTLIDARLAPDMLSFAGQIQRASDNAKGAVTRLAAIDNPSYPDTEKTFDELRARIAKTVAFLDTLKPGQFDGAEGRPVSLGFRTVSGTFRGDLYLLQVVLPNFFFHVATAHAILRSQGLQIGKMDYLGPLG